MPKNDSGEHVADAGKMVPPNAAVRAVAARFMQTIAARFEATCQKFGIDEETASSLLLGTLLFDEPANAEAFEVAWSDVYDEVVGVTEAEHNVTVDADCYYVGITSNDTGDSVLCVWGDEVAYDRGD